MDSKDVIAYVCDLAVGAYFRGKQRSELGRPGIPARRAFDEPRQRGQRAFTGQQRFRFFAPLRGSAGWARHGFRVASRVI